MNTGRGATDHTDVGRLTRAAGVAPRPVRIVHLGLGAFHRAHQAWYTSSAPDADEWGIVAFTGRSPDAALTLAAQDGLFTLVTRGPESDEFEIIDSIVLAVDGADLETFLSLVAQPQTSIVTLTVTEAGYCLDDTGQLDLDNPAVVRDLAELLRADPAPETTPARLALALARRREQGSGAITIVPCDNLPNNGAKVAAALRPFLVTLDPGLAEWVDATVSFVSTSIDRITPKQTPEDIELVRASRGYRDEAVVVTEPFSDWTLSGEFPAGRPDWEAAGARFVDDIEPYERRKLWLLNGGHTLFASAGQLRGHTTVDEAAADPVCREWLLEFWAEASTHLDGVETAELERYQNQLLERFENSRIRHLLTQIAQDSLTKIKLRALPIIEAELAQGRLATGSLRILAGWLLLGGHDPAEAATIFGREYLAEPLIHSELNRLAATLAN